MRLERLDEISFPAVLLGRWYPHLFADLPAFLKSSSTEFTKCARTRSDLLDAKLVWWSLSGGTLSSGVQPFYGWRFPGVRVRWLKFSRIENFGVQSLEHGKREVLKRLPKGAELREFRQGFAQAADWQSVLAQLRPGRGTRRWDWCCHGPYS